MLGWKHRIWLLDIHPTGNTHIMGIQFPMNMDDPTPHMGIRYYSKPCDLHPLSTRWSRRRRWTSRHRRHSLRHRSILPFVSGIPKRPRYDFLRSLNITICNFGHVSEKLCHFQVTQPTKELVMMSIKAPKKPFKQEPISSACSKGVISGSTTNGVCFKWFSIANVRLDEVR